MLRCWRSAAVLKTAQKGRLVLLTLVAAPVCWLLAATSQRRLTATSSVTSHNATPWPDEGRYHGRLIRQLWATNLPQQEWFTDDACRHFVTRFARDDALEVVRLASFPRSGNTWARYLLETATGLFTSAGGPDLVDYNGGGGAPFTVDQIWQHASERETDFQLVAGGYLGDAGRWTQGNTIVAKFHNLPQPWPQNDTDAGHSLPAAYRWAAFAAGAERRAILLIRDPLHALLSLRRYSSTRAVWNDDWPTDGRLYSGADWEAFVTYYAHHWLDFNSRWLDATNATLVVAYERMTRQPVAQLERMLRFLHVQPEPARMACVARHLEGTVHNRRHTVTPDDATFPMRLRSHVWSLVHELNEQLRDGGHQRLPLEQYAFADQFMDIGLSPL